jgi:hypothetical protein
MMNATNQPVVSSPSGTGASSGSTAGAGTAGTAAPPAS